MDVTEMNSFRVVRGGRGVRVGTGTHLIDLYTRLAAHGLAVPGGSCPTVGVAGLALGGGVGVLARAFGLSTQRKNGRLVRVPSYAKSDFFTRRLSAAGIHALVAGIERMRGVHGAAGGVGAVAFDACGGAINRVPAAATAFVHRDSLFLAQYSTSWKSGAPAGGVARQHAWLRGFYTSMRPYASGQAYQNYVDPDLTNWRQAYYGANYPRLAHVKAVYDPQQVFRFPQAITPGP